MTKTETPGKKWWDGACVYQIYLRSFYDTNGDGVGDLRGVIEKLDYLAGDEDSLGVNAIWVSPFYPSPMADFGYDVSDYCAVDPAFGTMADFDELVQRAHEQDIRIIIDFIPNHSSDHHPWFKQSRSSRDNPKRDWYIWRDGKNGQPPNNWVSAFKGSAWQLDKPSGQYYLHTFLKEQPDLNWDNPEVRQAMCSSMRFWLDKGVDGFRVDAVNWLSKDKHFKNDPVNPKYKAGQDSYHKLLHHFSREGSQLFNYLNDMVDVCGEYDERFMITEAYPDIDDSRNYYSNYYRHLHHNICAPFNFEAIESPWDAQAYLLFINRLQRALLPGQISIYVMGNHDKPRLASRLGRQTARSAAMLLLTLPGMPFMYYGDELGLRNVSLKSSSVKDPYASARTAGRPESRTPMQWSSQTNSGFSQVKPWLPVSEDYADYNAASEAANPESFLNLYKTLVRLRNNTPAIKHGSYEPIDLADRAMGFIRRAGDSQYIVVINFSAEPIKLTSAKLQGRVLLSSYLDSFDLPAVQRRLSLRPHEGVVISAPS